VKFSRKKFLQGAAAVCGTLSAGVAFSRPGTASASVLRPPGAIDEEEFLARCIRCGRCGEACPNQCIRPFTASSGRAFSLEPGPGEEGTPAVFPRRQACNLCASDSGGELLCTAVCPTGALTPVSKNPDDLRTNVRMGIAEIDLNLCYSYNGSSCGVCVRACPLEGTALKAGLYERPLLDPDACVGCGLCERSCIRYPQAISVIPRAVNSGLRGVESA